MRVESTQSGKGHSPRNPGQVCVRHNVVYKGVYKTTAVRAEGFCPSPCQIQSFPGQPEPFETLNPKPLNATP